MVGWSVRGTDGRGTRGAAASLTAGLVALLLLVTPAVAGAAVPVVEVNATVETTPVPNTGDAADDPAVWVHPTNPSLSTIIGTDKTAGGGLAVYDLAGRQLFFYPDGRLNNVDVRYSFPLGSARVSLVGATNRVLGRVDFYRVDPATRGLVKAGSVATSPAIGTPRGFSFYVSPVTGKYYAFVTDGGRTDQYELGGATGSVTGTLVRQFTRPNPTEGLVADDKLGRVYLAEENVGGIWRYGGEPGDGATAVKVDGTTETGGTIIQDVKGLALYYGANGRGYLIAASQGGSSFHIYNRGDNVQVGEFKIVTGGGIDGVTGEDGIDVTNFALGACVSVRVLRQPGHPQRGRRKPELQGGPLAGDREPLLATAAHRQHVDRGRSARTGTDTSITSGPSGRVRATTASFGFTATVSGSTFQCALDAAAFSPCVSPTAYTGVAQGAHTFRVRATDPAGHADASPAGRSWTVDLTAPTVTATVPEAGTTGVSAADSPRATFSEEMDQSSLTTSSFRIVRQGTTTSVAAAVTYDDATRTATLDPTANLAPAAAYTATLTTDARDVAGPT